MRLAWVALAVWVALLVGDSVFIPSAVELPAVYQPSGRGLLPQPREHVSSLPSSLSGRRPASLSCQLLLGPLVTVSPWPDCLRGAGGFSGRCRPDGIEHGHHHHHQGHCQKQDLQQQEVSVGSSPAGDPRGGLEAQAFGTAVGSGCAQFAAPAVLIQMSTCETGQI